MKLDQKYFQNLMKQNGGHFWKSIFLQISITNFWFFDRGIEIALLNCIFLTKKEDILRFAFAKVMIESWVVFVMVLLWPSKNFAHT